MILMFHDLSVVLVFFNVCVALFMSSIDPSSTFGSILETHIFTEHKICDSNFVDTRGE